MNGTGMRTRMERVDAAFANIRRAMPDNSMPNPALERTIRAVLLKVPERSIGHVADAFRASIRGGSLGALLEDIARMPAEQIVEIARHHVGEE